MSLFDPTGISRPDATLFTRRGDPNDVRLGEVVRADDAGYADARIVVLGCPQDEGVRRNGGRPGAARAPEEIRRALYPLTAKGLDGLRLFDLGDTMLQPTLEETHALHQRLVRGLLDDGKRVVVLGGGNDLSYPDCAALSHASAGNVLAINIDAHFDVRVDPIRNSGTPYRQLIEEGLLHADSFFEIGSQPFANSPTYERWLREMGVTILPARDLLDTGIEHTLADILNPKPKTCPERSRRIKNPKYIFWGFDLDVVRASDAPGVSAPNPIGLSGDDLCRMADIAGRDPRTRVIEFTEVNPNYDVDGRTARLTAVAIWHALCGFARHL